MLLRGGSGVGADTLDVMSLSDLTPDITQLPTLEPKRFLRHLRSGKVKKICLLITEDEYVANMRSEIVFAENKRILSSSSIDDLIEFTDVSPESVLCGLLKAKGTRHEIDLFPAQTILCPLPRAQVEG
ncbi:unnamed protein product [Peronospora belbahrii]|uniref:Uncharacterized protein n=1 Tax=Peronospora belbahrii TaxID=622444 RepID=A0AAU9LBN5_9STRA|nr:unnamed protein product [Peronospora belbahrii]